MVYVFALFGTFVAVFAKGFQHKNVMHNLYVPTFITSYAMAFLDVILIGLIAKSGWDIAFASGAGASFGMVAAMYVHNRFMGKGKTNGRETADESSVNRRDAKV